MKPIVVKRPSLSPARFHAMFTEINASLPEAQREPLTNQQYYTDQIAAIATAEGRPDIGWWGCRKIAARVATLERKKLGTSKKKVNKTPRQVHIVDHLSQFFGKRPQFSDKSGKNRRYKWWVKPDPVIVGVANDWLEGQGYEERVKVSSGHPVVCVKPS